MLCRLCLSESKLSHNIISSKSKCADLTLIESLYWIFGVEVDVNDPYSKNICLRCVKVIQDVGIYRTFYRRNQLILQGELNCLHGFQESQELPTDENEQIAFKDSDLVPRPKMNKSDFIKYYYDMPTTAIRELIRDKNKSQSETETDDEQLCQVNDEGPVEVCKYCSQIYATKKRLACHYDTKHRYVKIKKPQGVKSRKDRFRRNKRKKQEKRMPRLYSNKFKRNQNPMKSLFNVQEFPNLNFMKQLKVTEKICNRKKEQTKYFDGETINDERNTETATNNRYKRFNLKDLYIPIPKCEVPRGFHKNKAGKHKKSNTKSKILQKNCKIRKEIESLEEQIDTTQPIVIKKNVTNIDVYETDASVRIHDWTENNETNVDSRETKHEIVNQYIKQEIEDDCLPMDQRTITVPSQSTNTNNGNQKKQWTDCDGKILADCSTCEKVVTQIVSGDPSNRRNDLRDRYKSFNLKDFTITVERCPVPKGFYETLYLDEYHSYTRTVMNGRNKKNYNMTLKNPTGFNKRQTRAARTNESGKVAQFSQFQNLQVVIPKIESFLQGLQNSIAIKTEHPIPTPRGSSDMPQLQSQEEDNINPVTGFLEEPPKLEPQVMKSLNRRIKSGNSSSSCTKKTKKNTKIKAEKTVKKCKSKSCYTKEKVHDKEPTERKRQVTSQIQKLVDSLTAVTISSCNDNNCRSKQLELLEVPIKARKIQLMKRRISETVNSTDGVERQTKEVGCDFQSVIKSRWSILTRNKTDILNEIAKRDPPV